MTINEQMSVIESVKSRLGLADLPYNSRTSYSNYSGKNTKRANELKNYKWTKGYCPAKYVHSGSPRKKQGQYKGVMFSIKKN